MTAWLVSVLVWLASPEDVERLRASAPRYLTETTARHHLGSARLAAYAYDVPEELLLSVGHHESRYQVGEITPETGRKFSCGVMTPVPTRSRGTCRRATSSAADGYLHGAEHLRGWIAACRGSAWCALTGYAGGYYLLSYCRRHRHRNCGVAYDFVRRATTIRTGR